MLPTEDFGVKKNIVFAGCGFGACLPSNLCVLVSESDILRRPGNLDINAVLWIIDTPNAVALPTPITT